MKKDFSIVLDVRQEEISLPLQKNIKRPANVESTALGACKVAMMASGENISEIKSDSSNFEPNKSLENIYSINYNNWKEYINKNLSKS